MTSRKINKAGNAKRRVILEAAAHILITSGHHNLTMRKVSDTVGISLGNLTYHFPNKAELIEELIRKKLAQYLAKFDELISQKDKTSEGGIKNLIGWLLMDALDEEVNRLYRELWVMAKHYPAIAKAFSDYYETGVHKLAVLFSDYCPNIQKKDLTRAMYILATITEGTCIVFGGNHRMDIDIDEILPEILSMFENYLIKKDIST